jgi:quercetin dioxygenase-like cupin family protein
VGYVAQYMEGIAPPGTRNIPHRHSGPEAWYNLAGHTCVETPEEQEIFCPGETSFVAEGVPHMLTSVGVEMRRSLVIILRDASLPASVSAHDWTPRGLCQD